MHILSIRLCTLPILVKPMVVHVHQGVVIVGPNQVMYMEGE